MAKNRNEDITDLTADEESAGESPGAGGKGRRNSGNGGGRGAAQPAGANGSSEKSGGISGLFGKFRKSKDGPAGGGKGGNSEDGGKRKRLIIRLVIIIVPIILVAGFVTEEIIFNFLGARDFASKALITAGARLDPAFSSVEQTLRDSNAARDKRLTERETEFDRREAAISSRETVLGSRSADLDARDSALGERETLAQSRDELLDRRSAQLDRREEQINQAQTDASLPAYQREMTEQELADMIAVSSAYSRMAPEVAASILAEMRDPNDVVAILYYMNARNCAAVLAVMDPAYAARLTEILMR